MNVLLYVLFGISAFGIFWANIGFPISMLFLGKIIKRKNKKINDYEPTVTLMIAAHNEEKVIKEKLENVIKLDYPKDKIEILVTSDNSTDKTNAIVRDFIKKHSKENIRLYEVKTRKGKTNAQNEGAKTVKSEILVMTDANAMIKEDTIKELVSSFDDNVSYVTGRLVYSNSNDSLTSNAENTYWDMDTKIREIESNIQTITAGNGAIYACRTSKYYDFKPIQCHDSSMPVYYALKKERAVANHHAVAYEKAGENNRDEFQRKVRMARVIIPAILPSVKILNVFKYKWFTYFYLGHRTSRYLLWFNHLLLFIVNIILVICDSWIFIIPLALQLIVYIMALIKLVFKVTNKLFNFCFYYCMTVCAQLVGVIKAILRKNKPFWEKAESTR